MALEILSVRIGELPLQRRRAVSAGSLSSLLVGLVLQFVVLQDEHLGVVADGRGGLPDHQALLGP